MNKWTTFLIIGLSAGVSYGGEPFKPAPGSIPFMVYFMSRYRGMCVGTLVSRAVALTACVCVTHPGTTVRDTRPINVVTGTMYRHPRRGIRVQVTKILIPKLSEDQGERSYTIQVSPALLLLYRKVPDVLAEVPLRALDVDFNGEEVLALHEECLMTGWHFFYNGDKIFPGNKFLLQRNVRVQFINIDKRSMWCSTISLMFEKALASVGYHGAPPKGSRLCVRDVQRSAQACHGIYGAPLICRGRLVAIMSAPDAQWTNCTGFSNIVHMLSAEQVRNFMLCTSSLFVPDGPPNWELLKRTIYSQTHDPEQINFSDMYDKVLSGQSGTEDY